MNAHSNFKFNGKSANLVGVLVIMAVILAACMPAAAPTPASTAAPTAASTSAPTQAISNAPTVSIDVAADPTLGSILVDSNGFTLYVLTKDTPDTSVCNSACQANWPPLVSATTPKAGPGVDASLISLASLSNGEKIVTYNHRPLYYKATDKKAGDKTGEDFNSIWFVVSPAGQPVESESSATSSAQSISTPPPASPIVVTEPTLEIANSATLGKSILTIGDLTLYAYSEDSADKSNCGASCQAIWMPVYTLGKPVAGAGVNASLMGTAKLSNGSLILTYNHMPLYFFIHDKIAGDTFGQGFDNVWFAVSPDGKKVGSVTEATINIANNPTLGSYLVDGNGVALYTTSNDKPDTSTCIGACAGFWPPLLTLGKPNLGSGVDQTKVGTIKLADGSMMVTYNHMPLYYFAGDGDPTQILGQGFKSVWYVIGPDGNPIKTMLPAASTK